MLHDAGIQQIIPPIKTTHGNQLSISTILLSLCIHLLRDKNGFSRNLTDDQWVTLGKVMRQVHEIDVPPSIQNRIRREAYSPKWREAVRSLYAHIEAEPSGDEIALKLLTFMKEHSGGNSPIGRSS